MSPTGLRERKKLKTKEAIQREALRLFQEQGYAETTIEQIAAAAEISPSTFFNYFPTKEDLYFGGMLFFEEKLLGAVRERPPGESVLAAFRRPIFDGFKRLAGDEAIAAIVATGNVIHASPALEIREREIAARYTALLADLIAEEAGVKPGDVEAVGVASALMGVQRALVAYVRTRVLAGRRGEKLVSDARSQATRAFARLEKGLSGYGSRPSRTS